MYFPRGSTDNSSMHKLIFVFILAMLSSGCATVNTQLPLSRFELPETNGAERRVRLAAGATAVQSLTVIADAADRPLNVGTPTLDVGHTGGFMPSVGLFDAFDIGLRTTAGNSPVMVTAKLQLLGPSASAATAGSFSFSIAGAAGYWRSQQSGDQETTFGPGGFPWESVLSTRAYEGSAIMGLHLSDNTVFYVSGFYTDYAIDVSVKHSESDDGTSPEANYDVDFDGFTRGGSAGMKIGMGKLFYLLFEGIYAETRFSSPQTTSLTKYMTTGGAQFGFHF